jgi:tetratricopeptide (TPR) repeat protein
MRLAGRGAAMRMTWLVVCAAAAGPAGAQRSPLPQDRLAQVRSALDAMYRMDFETAEARCRKMIEAWPDDPAGFVYLARVYWQQLLVQDRALSVHRFIQPDFFVEKPPTRLTADLNAVARFRKANTDAIARAETAVRNRPGDPASLYLLGAAYQNEASFLLSISRQWWQAFRAGSRSERADRELLKLDPGYSDALMVIGLFHYTVGALPGNIRWIPLLLGYHGTKAAGEREMELAAARGQLVADDARALLAVLYAIDGRYSQALAKLEELAAKYPENYLTQLDIGGIKLRMGKPDEAVAVYRKVLDRIDGPTAAGGAAAAVLERAIVFNQLGIAYRKMGRHAEAERWLRTSLVDRSATAYTRAQAQLELGKTLDREGRRGEATAQYRLVLEGPDRAGAHDEAEGLLKRPYKE